MTAKRIVITGAASGIGAATMNELRRLGHEVAGLDRNAEADGLISCDVRDQASVDRAVAEAIQRLGGLDVLINCAGVATPQSAGLPPDDRAVAVIDINLLGPWRVTSAALSTLRASRGRVVNVASGMAFVALPFAVAYAMSKHGVVAYSGALRLEHGDTITVTTVYPGVVRTGIQRDAEEFGLGMGTTSPEERIEDVVAAFVRAAIGNPPLRDITTTKTGLALNSISRFAPRRVVDKIILASMRRGMKSHTLPDTAAPPLTDFARRLTTGGRRR